MEELAPVEVPADLLIAGVPPVDDDAVAVIAGLAPRAREHPAGSAIVLMAGPEGSVRVDLAEISAVQGAGMLAQPVDILQDVYLAVRGPRALPQHPERRPVAEGIRLLRLLQHGDDPQFAACRRSEGFPGLNAARRPRA